MALLSDLVRIVAEVEGLEEVSVGIFARAAREAGYISQGGRGRSAAKMTITDAANLLIAVNGCSLAKEVPKTIELVRSMSADNNNKPTDIGIGTQNCKFGDDLEQLICCFYKLAGNNWYDELPGATFVRFFRPNLMAEIEMTHFINKEYKEEKITYGRDQPKNEILLVDRSDETVISHVTLRAVAESIK